MSYTLLALYIIQIPVMMHKLILKNSAKEESGKFANCNWRITSHRISTTGYQLRFLDASVPFHKTDTRQATHGHPYVACLVLHATMAQRLSVLVAFDELQQAFDSLVLGDILLYALLAAV